MFFVMSAGIGRVARFCRDHVSFSPHATSKNSNGRELGMYFSYIGNRYKIKADTYVQTYIPVLVFAKGLVYISTLCMYRKYWKRPKNLDSKQVFFNH